MFGDTLKRTRLIYGYNAKEMSERLSISNSYLSEIENGKKKPSLDILERYASIYEIKLSSLILLSEEVESSNNNTKGNEFTKKILNLLITKMSNGLE